MQNLTNYSLQEEIIISFEDFLAGINDRTSGKGIKQIDFYLRNYPHYHSCSIDRYIDKFNINGETKSISFRITCILAKDHAEDCSFGHLTGNEHIFRIGRAGKRSLSQVWPDVITTNITYWDEK